LFFLHRISENKKAELAAGLSSGSSAILSKDPPLSVPSSRKVWLYRGLSSLFLGFFVYLEGL